MIEKKVWGYKFNLFSWKNGQIDLLLLKPNSFCSWHYHIFKINVFLTLFGLIFIERPFGWYKNIRKKVNYAIVDFGVHRFRIWKIPSIMIEIAYGNPYKLDDIDRLRQGGRIINGKEFTERELNE